jgi:hypothetical protein
LSESAAYAPPPAARASVGLAALCLVFGVALAMGALSSPPWQDEFNTYVTTRAHSLHTFFEHVLRGQHPLLFEGPIYLLQRAGVTDIAALRLLNFLGVPLVLVALWISHKRGVMDLAQAAVAIGLYASSNNLLFYLDALRPYFLVFSASIAAALAWRLIVRQGREKTLWLWFGALAVLVNLHYFATIFGGLLTLGLIAHYLRLRDWRGAVIIAATGLLAAAPALVTGALQSRETLDGGTLYYFAPGASMAFGAFGAAALAAIAYNLPALLATLAGLRTPRAFAPELALIGIVVMFFALLLIAHLIRPMLFDRYLIAAAGAILIPVAIMAPPAHRLTAPAICVFAIGVQVWALAFAPRFVGWTDSAEMVAAITQSCAQSQVYTVPYARVSNGPIWETPLNPTEIEARRYGYDYYAARHHFTVRELRPGDSVSASGKCPSIIWIEHFWPATPPAYLLYNLKLYNSAPARFTQIGSGVVVAVARAP